MIIQNSGRNLF